MAGRGPQSFKKRQKEQQRKERQEEKMARRLQRKHDKAAGIEHDQSGSEGDTAQSETRSNSVSSGA